MVLKWNKSNRCVTWVICGWNNNNFCTRWQVRWILDDLLLGKNNAKLKWAKINISGCGHGVSVTWCKIMQNGYCVLYMIMSIVLNREHIWRISLRTWYWFRWLLCLSVNHGTSKMHYEINDCTSAEKRHFFRL